MSTFAGFHRKDDEDWFAVFRLDDGWYWQLVAKISDTTTVPRSMIHGPFPTDEGAYLSAIGD